MILPNAKHEKYAYLRATTDKSQGECAAEAGYSKKRCRQAGSELEAKPQVLARILEIREEVAKQAIEKAAVDKAWVLKELVDNVRVAKSGIPLLDDKGRMTGKKKINLTAANEALSLIGKELGMFIDRKEIRTGPLSKLTDEQLIELTRAIDAGVPASALEAFAGAGEGSEDQGKPAQVLPTLQ